jgi:glucokinase
MFEGKNRWNVGIDLGGTKIEVGLVDSQGQIIESCRLETDVQGGVAAVEQQMVEVVRSLASKSPYPLEGVGIGVAGQVEARTGRVIFAPNLYWHDVPLQEDLRRLLSLPVAVVNDVRAATWGEWLYGAGRQTKNLVCLFIGTGIGGGVVANGSLLTGSSNTLGELGHLVVDFRGPLCTCGNKGCLEAFAGGWGVAKQAQEAILNGNYKHSILMEMAHGDIRNITAKTIVQAAEQGDFLARQILEQMEQALIAGIVSIIHAFNPERLVIGGGLFEGLPGLIERIEPSIRKKALKAALTHLNIIPAQLHQQAGVIGAAVLEKENKSDE